MNFPIRRPEPTEERGSRGQRDAAQAVLPGRRNDGGQWADGWAEALQAQSLGETVQVL